MLEGLDSIEWDKLGHAYGSAEDVPGLIRDLASPEEEAREKAFYELYGNIWHQGTVYEATTQAVPFFIELLTAEEVQDKDQILLYLTRLSEGNSYIDVHRRLPLYEKLHGEQMKTAQWKEDLQKELRWVRQVHDGVEAGKPVYLKLLADGSVQERDAAAFLLARLDNADGKTGEQIIRQLETETEATVQVSLLFALGELCEYNDGSHAVFSSFLERGYTPSVWLAAAMVLTKLAPEQATEEIIAIFIEAIEHRNGYEEFEGSAWADDEKATDCLSRNLPFIEGKATESIERALTNALVSGKHSAPINLVDGLLALAFHSRVARGTPFSSLDTRQQRVLKLLVENQKIWGTQSGVVFIENVDLMGRLKVRGLPDRYAALSAYVRGENAPAILPPTAVQSGGMIARVIKTFRKPK